MWYYTNQERVFASNEKGMNTVHDLQKVLMKQFELLHGKIDRMDRRFTEKFEQIDNKFEQMENKFEQMDSKFEHMENKFEHMENMVTQLITMNGKALEHQNRLSGETANLQLDFNYLSQKVLKNELHINRLAQS